MGAAGEIATMAPGLVGAGAQGLNQGFAQRQQMQQNKLAMMMQMHEMQLRDAAEGRAQAQESRTEQMFPGQLSMQEAQLKEYKSEHDPDPAAFEAFLSGLPPEYKDAFSKLGPQSYSKEHSIADFFLNLDRNKRMGQFRDQHGKHVFWQQMLESDRKAYDTARAAKVKAEAALSDPMKYQALQATDPDRAKQMKSDYGYASRDANLAEQKYEQTRQQALKELGYVPGEQPSAFGEPDTEDLWGTP